MTARLTRVWNNRNGLWLHRNFMQLWIGETISLFGSQITNLALPLTAAVILKATPEQMGVLTAINFLPFLLVGLFAGVWVDRRRRKPILIGADFGRAILLATIPAAALLNVLRIEQLYVVGFIVGVLTVFFDVAYQSYLPSLVGREDILEGNSKLEISRSITQIGGPGVAGLLVQAFTAPFAMVIDALSFLFSAVFLSRIDNVEPAPLKAKEQRNIFAEIWEGLWVVIGNRTLRSIAFCTATSNLFANVAQTVFILYATRRLNLDAAALGLIFGIASLGALVGAFNASKIAKHFGLGRTITFTIGLVGFGGLFIPLAYELNVISILVIVFGQSLGAFGGTVYNINQVSLRQTITPHRLLGRMNASMRFIVWGTIPVGALIGGFLGGAIGLRPTLVIGSFGALLAPLWIYFSPVRKLKTQPEPIEDDEVVLNHDDANEGDVEVEMEFKE